MISEFSKILLVLLLFFLMMGMGATLTVENFKKVLQKPKGVFIGFASQFGWMPLIAYGLSHLLNLPPAMALGLILIGCTPGGTTSNLYTYFSKGDVALSISMTVISTITSIFMMPLLLYFYASPFTDETLAIPYSKIVVSLVALIIPVMIGMFIRAKSESKARIVEKFGAGFGIFIIIYLIFRFGQTHGNMLVTTDPLHLIAPIALGFLGLILGFAMSKVLGMDSQRARTVSLETGLQNSSLTWTIILLTFPKEQVRDIIHLPLIYGVAILFIAAAATILFRRMET